MKKKEKETGKKAALRVAYEAVMEPKKVANNVTKTKYTHARLKKITFISRPTLRRISRNELGEKSPIDYYIGAFLSILDKEYQSAVEEGNTAKMNTKLRNMREVLLLEHELMCKEFD